MPTPRTKVRIDWAGPRVQASMRRGMKTRLALIGSMLGSQVKVNLSVPVLKRKSAKTGKLVVVQRSKPGEFPRLDTGALRRGIFYEMLSDSEVIIASDRWYSLPLEQQMERQFLTRSLRENLSHIERILGAPIRLQGGP